MSDPITTREAGYPTARNPQRFCALCDVDLGLHGTDEPTPDDCRSAAAKADLLRQFDVVFGVYG